MTKKAKIMSAVFLGSITAFAIGVAVPIAVKKHDKQFVVNTNASDTAHYFVLKIKPDQNKAESVGTNFMWDVISSGDAKSKAADFYKIDVVQVVATIKSGYEYRNGLEHLIFDLLNVKNNGDILKLEFPNSVKTPGTANEKNYIMFDSNFITPSKGSEKDNITARFNLLKKNGKYYDQFLAFSKTVNLYDSETKSISLTTEEQVEEAIDNIYKKIVE